MAITANDIAILRAERFTDNPDGGGAMTGVVIPNGVVNNLWDDISRDTLAYGGVSLRKMFGAVRSQSVDKGLGSHAIILADADAANVSTLLVATKDHYDQRAQAREEIERYVVLGTRSGLRPVGTQRKGQTSLVLYTEDAQDIPELGETLVLFESKKNIEQAFKVIKAERRNASYTYINKAGDYDRYSCIEVTLKISQELEAAFAGNDPSPIAKHDSEIFKTQSNAGAKYYGIKPLALPAAKGAASVTVDSIFAPIVPAATVEQALVDQHPGLLSAVVQPTAAKMVLSLGSFAGEQLLTLPVSWVPGSLQLTVGGTVYREDGKQLVRTSGVERFTGTASVDSSKKRLSFNANGTHAVSVQLIPGVAVELTPYTDWFEITAGNRQLTYTDQLGPVPMPGSVRVEFQYLGNWYVLQDNATGALIGPASSGTVDYSTGSISYVLPGEPDEGSTIITTWARSPYLSLPAGALDLYMPLALEGNFVPESVAISWAEATGAKSATCTAAGVIQGQATGSAQGSLVRFVPMGKPTSDIQVSYNTSTTGSQSTVALEGGSGNRTLTLPTGLTSFKFGIELIFDSKFEHGGVVLDTSISGNANFTLIQGVVFLDFYGVRAIGTYNASTGATLLRLSEISREVLDYQRVLGRRTGKLTSVRRAARFLPADIVVHHDTRTSVEAKTLTLPLADIVLRAELADTPLVPGSVHLSLGGVDIVDMGDGSLQRGFNVQTASGLACGSIDHRNAKIELPYSTLKAQLASLTSSLNAAAGGLGAASAVDNVVFRTQASPLRPSGLQFLARRATDGALMRASSNNAGEITGSFDASNTLTELPQPGSVNGYSLPLVPNLTGSGTATGSVDSATGVVKIAFSQPVILSTLTYNAVAYTTVPLSPEIIGLNPVRLPTNGTVPIFNPGYLVVVHNTQTQEIPSPQAGQMLSCGRTDVAVVSIADNQGKLLAPAQYSLDKAAGTVTLASPFSAIDSTGAQLSLPLTLSHRVEDMAALGAVSVGGELKLITQLNHDYPLEGSFVSGAVHFGTLQARVSDIYDMKTDNGLFAPEGSESAAAEYDSINFPILIANRNAVEDKWKIKFTSATAFQCFSQKRGLVGSGSISSDFSPLNPHTQEPYFTIRKEGWGGGWITSNVLGFTTKAAAAPFWAIRTVLPSNLPAPKDQTLFEFRVEAE